MTTTPLDPPELSATAPLAVPGLQEFERSFFERPVLEVARDLIGKLLVRRDEAGRVVAGRIVEVEAYGGEDVDAAAHSFNGPTPRCQVMFGPAGLAYVYPTQSRCFCVNVTTGGRGGGRAVLLRAVDPVHGMDLMRARRMARLQEGPTRRRLEKGRSHELAQGPGRLCMAFSIDINFNGADLTDGRGLIFLASDDGAAKAGRRAVDWTPRIGINPNNAAAGWCWRAADARALAVSSRRLVKDSRRPEPHPAFEDVAGG